MLCCRDNDFSPFKQRIRRLPDVRVKRSQSRDEHRIRAGRAGFPNFSGPPEDSPCSVVGTSLIGAVLGFYDDALALADKERNVDIEAGFHRGWLVDIVCGVPFDALG